MSQTHDCNGDVITRSVRGRMYRQCRRCHAFTFDLNAPLPTGTDVAANMRAWSSNNSRSPDSTPLTVSDIARRRWQSIPKDERWKHTPTGRKYNNVYQLSVGNSTTIPADNGDRKRQLHRIRSAVGNYARARGIKYRVVLDDDGIRVTREA